MVPGSLFYLNKSSERAQRRTASREYQTKKPRLSGQTGEVRLQRARKAARRHPRSRRQLERLVLGDDNQNIKQLQDNDHTVNKYYSVQIGDKRPKSAIELTGRPISRPAVGDYHGEHSTTTGDQVHLGYRDLSSGSMKNIVQEINSHAQTTSATRSRVICSMLERKQKHDDVMNRVGRPKSAPSFDHPADHMDDEDDDEEANQFDWETGNQALKKLEDKLRSFFDKNYPGDGRKTPASVTELKRFVVEGPEDVPIPGGTVYVRQRACQYPGGANTEHHKHVRRFIIPKDAYRVAVRSLSAMDGQQDEKPFSRASRVSSAQSSRTRPFTAAPRATDISAASQNGTIGPLKNGTTSPKTRVQSAPIKRTSVW